MQKKSDSDNDKQGLQKETQGEKSQMTQSLSKFKELGLVVQFCNHSDSGSGVWSTAIPG